jgi:MGT family glycosyltransferase
VRLGAVPRPASQCACDLLDAHVCHHSSHDSAGPGTDSQSSRLWKFDPDEALDRDKPLVYISLGTLFNAQPEFYRRALAAFAHGRYQVVLSVSCKTPISSLGAIPSHVIVQPSVPQLDILQRAALFITHGGMNSRAFQF